MDARQRLAALPRKSIARGRKPCVADDAPPQGFALDALHHVALAHAMRRLQQQHHFRHRHADGSGGGLQLGLLRQRGMAGTARGGPGRGTAQDQRQRAAVGQAEVEGPGLLAGATRQAMQCLDVPALRMQLRRQRLQTLPQQLLLGRGHRSVRLPRS